jgi:hypothetical protein
MRLKARRDANEPEICAVLDQLRIPYRHVSAAGLPDLEIIFCGRPYLAEIKTAKGQYKPAQIKRRDWLHTYGVDLDRYAPTFRSPDDVLTWVRATRGV